MIDAFDSKDSSQTIPAAPAAADPSPPAKTASFRFKYLPHYIRLDELGERHRYAKIKPVLDWLLAAAMLIPALPLILLCALAVRLTWRGPGFYTQVRLGKHGRPYTLIEIRTMVIDAEQVTGPRWAIPGDQRITKVGDFLRKTHLDELPQLFNVLRGDMSLTGPRPERPEIVPTLEEEIPGYGQRLAVKPGVTGLAQVQLPADTDLASVRKKLSYDLYYVRVHSFGLDLRLVLCTAFKVLGISFKAQRRIFALPQHDEIERVSHLPLEAPSASTVLNWLLRGRG
jgi:lipopolysaccharide/colanic/teichoic acid biosynthesis glycosyltransferase